MTSLTVTCEFATTREEANRHAAKALLAAAEWYADDQGALKVRIG
jgi:hypothetical protein